METGKLQKLTTEARNPNTMHIGSASALEIAEMINREDHTVADAVALALPSVAALMEAAAQTVSDGGRIVYIGAGTSGRLAVLDAVECRPTYGVSDDTVQALLAGGERAMFRAVEGEEDSLTLAPAQLQEISFSEKDILIGIAASGRTPYVIGALRYAHSVGAKTGSIACVPQAEISALADYPIEVVTGAEAVTGSTRMKGGTAEKMVLNMLSTGAMILCGKVYGNLMVEVQATNDKLKARARRIVMEGASVEEKAAADALQASGGSVKLAILMLHTGLPAETAQALLQKERGRLQAAEERFYVENEADEQ